MLAQRPDNLSAQVMDLLLKFYIGNFQKGSWGKVESLELIVDDMVRLAKRGRIDS